ncbi:hypothetical protein BZL30_5441 [Mycobacterium kansasii]|uniref:Uncharacterized protein n=1 Tax=Mycobacterium kansasii TaxID=1768 RepID=A0A1V3WZ29_MYCKA|nr:hypothetical protein BZL30_5441 [Mycobacterium kansasii]
MARHLNRWVRRARNWPKCPACSATRFQCRTTRIEQSG